MRFPSQILTDSLFRISNTNLDKKAIAHGDQKLSQNSKYSYFNKLRAALKQAVKDGILPTNPSEGVDAFKQGEPEREFPDFGGTSSSGQYGM